ncbi:glycosyltransferase family 2 protein [Butyricimonas virosa]|uniref:glycosyltransferase family 2 protein n=1 Tax=Butyricimonas virosa TaxID=544645 RepID=UPI00266548F4|nr:glycosyltransferase family A protein [Butyricimonas virosa]
MRELSCYISVIIPAYNVEAFLARCLDSVLGQSFRNFEVVVVDDGSRDRTAEIIRGYQQKDSRVVGIFKENGGVTSARNAGVAKAKGDYLFFLDGDDYIPSTALNDLFVGADQGKNDVVFGLFALVWKGKQKIYQVNDFGTISNLEYLKLLATGKAPWQIWSKLIRRTLFYGGELEVPTDLAVGEDALTLFQLVEKANTISMVNKLVYYYVQRENSVMHTGSPKLANDNLRAAKLISKSVEKSGLMTELSLYVLALRLLFLLMAFQKSRQNVCRDSVEEILKEYDEHKQVMDLFSFSKKWKIRIIVGYYKCF